MDHTCWWRPCLYRWVGCDGHVSVADVGVLRMWVQVGTVGIYNFMSIIGKENKLTEPKAVFQVRKPSEEQEEIFLMIRPSHSPS
jgi:hypothetical protein